MGKNSHGKSNGRGNIPVPNNTNNPKRLSMQKRDEINRLTEKLLKVSSLLQSSSHANKEWEIHLEVKKILEKLLQVEAEMKVAVPDRSSGFQEFYDWMVSNGAEINGLKITRFPGYDYGLEAVRQFEDKELILSIPRKVMITVDNARESALGTLMRNDAMLQHMPNIALALFLLMEKFKPDSFWKKYISVLPSSYNTVLYFATSDFQELKGSPSLEPALKQCRNIIRQYAYFSRLFQDNEDPASKLLRDVFTYDEYRWAVSTVMTRQNFVPSIHDPSLLVNALIPLWDMCNHDNGKISTDFSPEFDCSMCYADRDYMPGDQVFIFYGMRSNSEFLIHNGFVFLQNLFDSVKLKLGVSKADPLSTLRTKLLTNLGLPVSGEFHLKIGAEPVEGILLAFLRIFSMGKDDLEHWLSSERTKDLMFPDCALNTEVEIKAWNFLLNRIKLLISAYPTTMERDEEILCKATLSPCLQLAVSLRLSEKKILHNALGYIEQRVRS